MLADTQSRSITGYTGNSLDKVHAMRNRSSACGQRHSDVPSCNTPVINPLGKVDLERMDKNNCKLKIIYINALIPVPHGSICYTYQQLKYSSTNRSTPQKTTNKQNPTKPTTTTRATQKSLPFGNRRFREKEVRRLGQKQKRIQTERATGLGRRTKEDI